MAKRKPQITLSKRDLETLMLISNPQAQAEARENMIQKRAAGKERSKQAFGEYLKRSAYRRERSKLPLSIEVVKSKKGKFFIRLHGGGLFRDLWLTGESATNLHGANSQLIAAVKKLQAIQSQVVETVNVESVDVDESETA